VVALVLLTILPPVAAAAPVKEPAVDQYVESVPRADGGNDAAPRQDRELPPSLEEQIQQTGGEDAAALEAVAESPALGAPAERRGGGDRESKAAIRAQSRSEPSTLDAVASAASGDGNSGAWLLAALAVLTATLAGAAVARRRSLTR
jgi:hypothetical protein